MGLLARSLPNSAPGISQSLRATALHRRYLCARYGIRMRTRPHCWAPPAWRFGRAAGDPMPKASFVSVVDDDQFFPPSTTRLVTSLGYNVEDFASAADFLASPRLAETACLIADVHMPAMTGIELYRHLVHAGHAIPTILVTAYPNDVDRIRALND